MHFSSCNYKKHILVSQTEQRKGLFGCVTTPCNKRITEYDNRTSDYRSGVRSHTIAGELRLERKSYGHASSTCIQPPDHQLFIALVIFLWEYFCSLPL